MLKMLGASILAALISAPILAEPLTIATGKPGGGYDKRAQMIAERLTQRGTQTIIANKNGSDEISLALCNGTADLGIMQIDAIYARAQEGCTVKPVAIYGQEYAFLLFPPRADKDELDELTAQDAVLVDTIGSGSDLFWRTVVKIELGDDGTGDEWASARIINDPIELANASAEMGDITAMMLVRKPDSADITRLLDQGWQLGTFWDRDIDDLQFNGTPLYESEKATVAWGEKSARAYAYNVRSIIAVSQKVANGDRKTFATITGASQ